MGLFNLALMVYSEAYVYFIKKKHSRLHKVYLVFHCYCEVT